MCEKEEGNERRSLKIKFLVFALSFGVFYRLPGSLKTNSKLPVFWMLKGDDADQQNTVSRLQKRISAVPIIWQINFVPSVFSGYFLQPFVCLYFSSNTQTD